MKLFTKLILFVITVVLFNGSLKAQQRVRKMPIVKTHSSKSNLAIGVGLTRSLLFLTRNSDEKNPSYGYNINLTYGLTKILCVSVANTYYKPINIEPTWKNVESNTIEVNAHLLAKFDSTKTFFYPIFGLSYNHFSGFFTGKNDVLNFREIYGTNTYITTNWLGFNTGLGFEQHIKKFSLYIDYKMRVGFKDGRSRQVNILDVCIGGGIRYNLTAPSVYKIFKRAKNRYFIDTKN